MVSQNAFQKGPNAHTISLNMHIHILFANKRDKSQVSIFAHQLFHSKRKKKCFLDVYDEHMKNQFVYLPSTALCSFHLKLKYVPTYFPAKSPTSLTYKYTRLHAPSSHYP